MNLLELINQSNLIEKQLLENEGELSDALETMLAENSTALASKVDAYRFILDRFEHNEQALKSQADQLKAAAKRLENARTRIVQFIKQTMLQNELKELNGDQFRLVLSKSRPSLQVDLTKLPEQYKIIKTVYEADKERIRELLESGNKIEGAALIESHSLRSYVNTKGKL